MPAVKKEKEMSGIVSIDLSKVPDVPQDSAILQRAMDELTITDADSYARTSEIVAICHSRAKAIEAYFENDKKMANALHKSITAKIAAATAQFNIIKETGEGLMRTYKLKIEKDRIEGERKIKESGERAQHEVLEARRAALAIGDMKTARALAEQAETIVTDVVLPEQKLETPGSAGERRPFKATVENFMELIIAIAEGRVPLKVIIEGKNGGSEVDLLEVNQTALNYLAKRQGVDLKLPGVKVAQELEFAWKNK